MPRNPAARLLTEGITRLGSRWVTTMQASGNTAGIASNPNRWAGDLRTQWSPGHFQERSWSCFLS